MPSADYRHSLKSLPKYSWSDTLIPKPLSVNRWHTNGWVPPMLTMTIDGNLFKQTDIWQLVAAMRHIILTRPYGPTYYAVTACVQAPYALLYSSMTHGKFAIESKKDQSYYITCTGCVLTNCISSDNGIKFLMILRQPPYIMLPVELNIPWYDDYGLQVLQEINYALIRPKRFIGALILGITALIAIIGSMAASTVSLVQDIHTAQHVDQLTRNVSFALATQEIIDRKLDTKLNALEEAVLFIGNELSFLKSRLALRCHKEYSWICVTPLQHNDTIHTWENIQNHLLGIWNHSNFSIDVQTLHEQIQAINASSTFVSPSQVATSFLQGLQNFISAQGLNLLLTNIGMVAGVLVLILCLVPCFFKITNRGFHRENVELHNLHLQNKKGGEMLGALPNS
ncbi:endogenous retrovirus group K member 8 Env polyprotein-like isoform X1 [Hyaena hyaena]|uniref:endogenous retrovirus group K member 8 Env polyprotein-like isoform X1 n=1 Tax=Hyaena hyaena TaxID=95912 RepID=UPI0019245F3E|nr:endogenous retrovirus group K member 8 Env polyprotein-like isoform X1 [Hyaena hyaena]